MDGIEELRGVVVLAATNRRDLIDPALLRPGRLDLLLEMPFPDKAARLEIFRIHTREKPLEDDINLDQLAEITHGYVGADIEFVCRRAAMLAIRDFIHSGKKDHSILRITMNHFRSAMEMVER
jgi:transitional endoplasmic reticulum ATPase